jgi:hypothetical protein
MTGDNDFTNFNFRGLVSEAREQLGASDKIKLKFRSRDELINKISIESEALRKIEPSVEEFDAALRYLAKLVGKLEEKGGNTGVVDQTISDINDYISEKIPTPAAPAAPTAEPKTPAPTGVKREESEREISMRTAAQEIEPTDRFAALVSASEESADGKPSNASGNDSNSADKLQVPPAAPVGTEVVLKVGNGPEAPNIDLPPVNAGSDDDRLSGVLPFSFVPRPDTPAQGAVHVNGDSDAMSSVSRHEDSSVGDGQQLGADLAPVVDPAPDAEELPSASGHNGNAVGDGQQLGADPAPVVDSRYAHLSAVTALSSASMMLAVRTLLSPFVLPSVASFAALAIAASEGVVNNLEDKDKIHSSLLGIMSAQAFLYAMGYDVLTMLVVTAAVTSTLALVYSGANIENAANAATASDVGAAPGSEAGMSAA